jgi:histidine triad (HIT) family protein
MASIFTKIVSGEIPCHKVAETKDFLAFLDISPVAKGHVLCIPKKETDAVYDLDDESYAGLFLFAKHVAVALKKAVPCTKVGYAVVGLEVAHAHIHLIPINAVADMDFSKARLKPTPEELTDLAKKIHGFI